MHGGLLGELCGGLWGESRMTRATYVGSCVVRLQGRAVWGELCGAVWGHAPVTRWSRHTHTIASRTPSTRGIPHYPLTNCPPSCPCPPVLAHSSSQVVHCRVSPPHQLHAPVLVHHLAVYPASPTQGRVGLTDRLPHSAQTQCNPTR